MTHTSLFDAHDNFEYSRVGYELLRLQNSPLKIRLICTQNTANIRSVGKINLSGMGIYTSCHSIQSTLQFLNST